jgi:DNA polymerase-1
VRTATYRVAGEEVKIYRVEREEDLDKFRDFVRRNLRVLACDSETTGLKIHSKGFKVRLVQFGTPYESWIIPVEHGGEFVRVVIQTLRAVDKLIFQNGMYDLQVFDKCFGVRLEELWPKVMDTKLYAMLIDPRASEKGGIGTSLEDLSRFYIDAEVADVVKGSMSVLAKKYKTTKAKIWEKVDLNDSWYNLYAGMDTILAARLASILPPLVPVSARPLIAFEHKIAEICSYYERTGFLLDEEYSLELAARLLETEEACREIAQRFGVENVNSTDQVAEILLEMGVKLKDRTPTGKLKVDKKVIKEILDKGTADQIEFITAVADAKKARKWRTTWVEGFLDNMDEFGRCHASINTLQARTGRMSITGIPAQTLPSGDWIIRRCFIADPGHRLVSVDYQAQELRVLAALSGDKTMIQAFKDGSDLHLMTAQAAWGADVDKDSVYRKYAKVVNFGRVYGGGARTVSEQTGLAFMQAKKVVEAFDKRYPGVKEYSDYLANIAGQQGHIVTPSGRVLPVDKDRGYSALNYMVQSTSRDVTCRGIVKLHEAGFTPYMRLPIHDEVVGSLPIAHSEFGARRMAQLMAEDMGEVFIGTDAEVGNRSWGSFYMGQSQEEKEMNWEIYDAELVAA